ncbi:beta transducin-like protein [Beggiatoa sp. PS]|nr:beta transducin-like protein [Beggiatoa sp. PS]
MINYFNKNSLSHSPRHWQKKASIFLLFSGLFSMGNALAQEIILTFEGHTDSIESVAISNDGNTILSGSHDNTIKSWNLETGEEIQTFQGPTDFVMAVAFSSDDNTVLSGSADNTIKAWNKAGQKLDSFQDDFAGWFYSIAFSPTQNQALLSTSSDNTLKLWDTENGNETGTLKGHQDWVYLVVFSPDGNKALSASEDGTMKVWDIENEEEAQSFEVEHIWAAAFSPDGSQILTGGDDGTITQWDATTGVELNTLQGHTSRVYAVAFSADGSQAVSGDGQGTINIWDIAQGKAISTYEAHNDIVSSVTFLATDNNKVLSASYDNTIKLWDLTATPTETDETESGETEGNETEGSETEGSETEGSETEGNETESGETEGNETEGNETEGNETEGNETEGSETESDETEIQQPLVQFEASATSGTAPLTIELEASASTSASSDIVSYQWFASHVWDEQVTLTASGSTANLTFEQAGEYTLMLTVKDKEGRTSFDVQTIVVGNLAHVKFKGLDSNYTIGERIVVDLNVNAPTQEAVDLWVVVRLPSGELVYRMPTNNEDEEAIFSYEPVSFKTSVDTSKNQKVMTYTVYEKMGGNYTLYAFYVVAGKNPLEDGFDVLRSNLMFEETTLVNE